MDSELSAQGIRLGASRTSTYGGSGVIGGQIVGLPRHGGPPCGLLALRIDAEASRGELPNMTAYSGICCRRCRRTRGACLVAPRPRERAAGADGLIELP